MDVLPIKTEKSSAEHLPQHLPEERPIARLIRPISVFAADKASGGLVLLVAALAALVWANSPWWQSYEQIWNIRIGFGYSGREVFHSLHFWINDGLMTVFFLLAGLEIKRELLVGELASPRQAALPVAGALGGVLIPALIYTAFNFGGPGQGGWGIPMATDIAFAVGVIALLGSRVPSPLAVFLTALAIVDDIFAVLVIALFYSGALDAAALAWVAAALAALIVMNRMGVAEPIAYALPGLALWTAMQRSGVHPTISGVLLAAVIPARRFLDPAGFVRRARGLIEEFETGVEAGQEREEAVESLESACRHVEPPLHRMERAIQPWVSLVIMPLFAFANAGVRVVGHDAHGLLNPITLGVLVGLLLGKPVGILLASFLATRTGLAQMPEGVTWAQIHGTAWLGGIGFTMSLFVGGLAFGITPRLDQAKAGILAGSILAGIAGSLLLSRAGRRDPR